MYQLRVFNIVAIIVPQSVNITLCMVVKLQVTITYQITVKIAICCMSNNGKMRAFPSKKFAIIVPAKQVRMLETQQDIGWV